LQQKTLKALAVRGIHDSRVCVGGVWGVLSLDLPPEKILSLDPPSKNFFSIQKWENLAKKWHFFEIFWPTLEIFTNLL
jgi:hypothetical protein